jgi:hypothetical protein
METVRRWLGQPPDKDLVERSLRRHERVREIEQANLRALEARVRAKTNDARWRPHHPDADDRGAGA